jgi:hypothetical protein
MRDCWRLDGGARRTGGAAIEHKERKERWERKERSEGVEVAAYHVTGCEQRATSNSPILSAPDRLRNRFVFQAFRMRPGITASPALLPPALARQLRQAEKLEREEPEGLKA